MGQNISKTKEIFNFRSELGVSENYSMMAEEYMQDLYMT
jgi:hypothetical protein